MSVTRRQFLRLTALGAAAAGTGVYAWRLEPHWIEVVRRTLPVRGLPQRLAGTTLMQISDVHVGRQVDDAYLMDVFQRVADLAPDIVVLTGDLVSYHAAVFQQMDAVYRHFPRGRLATVGVLGNHDYGPAWKHPEIADRVAERVAPYGITVLRNQIKDVGGLQIVGLDDLWTKQFAPERVTAARRSHATGALSQSQSRYRRRADLGRARGMDPLRPHARRSVQGAVSAAAAAAGPEPALHRRRVSARGQPAPLHQSRRRPYAPRQSQRPPRGDAVRVDRGHSIVTSTSVSIGEGG